MNPLYVISASVPAGNRVRQFHNDDPGSARYLLMEPPHFRYGGFDLRTLDIPHLGPDDCWEVRSGERKVLRLYQDGTLIFRAAANESFLGWGMEHAAFLEYPRINPVPVVEVHASFAHLYARVLDQLHKPPTDILFRLMLRGAVWTNKRLFLTEYYDVPIWQVGDPPQYVVHSDPASETLTILPAQLREAPNQVAYELVAAFASLFEMPSDKIPFVREVGGVREIDINQIVKLRAA